MPSNNTGQIAIWQDAADVVEFHLSPQDAGVRVTGTQAPSTTISLPPGQPNDGDRYEVIDADGSASLSNTILVVPPSGTTIRGAANFSITVAYAGVVFTFDQELDDWTATAASTGPPGPTGPAIPPMTEIAAGATTVLTRAAYNVIGVHVDGAQGSVTFPTGPVNGDIAIIHLLDAVISAPLNCEAQAGASLEDCGDPGNYVLSGTSVNMTVAGQRQWWQWSATIEGGAWLLIV
jgi:hypothetical protein